MPRIINIGYSKGEKMSGKQNLSDINYKARLEKKLQLAKETPEPVFDLSDCRLTRVPSNIYPLCRVLRKEAFYLQKNQLTSLSNGGELINLRNLILLDISTNNFSKLPDNIDALQNLQVLNVSNNQLTELPNVIGKLQKLVTLNASHNKLKKLPDSIGNCKNMERLNVSHNEPLKELPSTLGRLSNLVELNLDSMVTYPPPEVSTAGVTAMLNFFKKELKDTSVPSTSKKCEKQIQTSPLTCPSDMLEEHIKRQEELKLSKQKERIEFEKSLTKQKEEEIKLQEQAKQQKAKILGDIKSKEKLLNEELVKMQKQKSRERAALIRLLQEEERKSNEIVNKILNLKMSQRINDSILWVIERKDEENYLLSQTKAVKSLALSEILVGMETLIEEDIRKEQNALAEKRRRVMKSLTSEIFSQQEELNNFMKKRSLDSAKLLEAIRKNEDLQKVAVTSLLEKSDAASWELAKQISIVQTQLAELTKIELKKKKLEADNQIAQLHENRLALTEVLVDLFEKQERRRKFLIETVEKMEQLKESYRDSSAFWMEQYNKLFDSKAHQMVKFLESVDQKLVFELFVNEVFQYLPLLQDVALENLNMNTLFELGVKNRDDGSKILQAVELYLKNRNSQGIEPSAPPVVIPSAPSEVDQYSALEECVICMDKKPEVVFLPCGHVCCCFTCFSSIASCPLCRKSIDQIDELVRLS